MGVTKHAQDLWPNNANLGNDLVPCDVSKRAKADEMEHVNDYRDWLNNKLGEVMGPLEKKYAKDLGSSEARNEIYKKVHDSFDQATKETKRRDISEHRIDPSGGRPF